MPQLDKYAFMTEFFWLLVTLLGIYYLSSFYILPLVLRNMIIRKNLTNFLTAKVRVAPFLSEYVLEDYVPHILSKNSYLYLSTKSLNSFCLIFLSIFKHYYVSLNNIFLRPGSFIFNKNVYFNVYSALILCKLYFFFLWSICKNKKI